MVLEVDFPDSVPIIVARPFFFRVLDGGVPPLGVEAHVVNLRGHGGSEGDWQTAGLPECLEDVTVAIRRLGAPPILIGHSMGGMIV